MHEIITLQFGQRSNYLASHFWNAQESYFTYSSQEESLVNHDVHFRAGQASDGTDTYTPRTVIYDLKGGFGSLRKINALYDITDHTAPVRGLWDGSTATQHERPIEPSRYQTLLEQGLPTFQLHDSDVRYWSDFNRVFYHPRSAVQISQYELNSQLMPFESWSAGEELFSQLDKEAYLLDRDVRPWAEECDQMQGLQLISGTDDAWGGYAAKYLDALRDEYGKTSIWVWGIENTVRSPRQTQISRSANAARSLRAVGQQASAYIRLATLPPRLPRYVNLASHSDWFTSALLCSAFESSALPTRLARTENRHTSLSLLEDTLNSTGNQNLLELQLSVKHPAGQMTNGMTNGNINGVHATGEDAEASDANAAQLGISFLPGDKGASRSHIFTQLEVHRSRLSETPQEPSLDPDVRMRRRQNEETIVERFDSSLLFPKLDTFPDNIYRTSPCGDGLELTAALSANSGMKDRLLTLRNDTVRALDLDEREEMYNELTELANAYSFGWDDGSDPGEDS